MGRELLGLPLVSRIGLALGALALLLDLVLYLSPTPVHAGHTMSMPMHHEGHLLALAAMVLVLAGVLIDAARRHRSTSPEEPHAHR
ncbi:MAG TPA: hypothetical protein VFW95_00750 [Candidatus Limnocylindria bacterium]|nr:hypothetical protein [Candidatus Limnocylindria bacterium]